MGMFGKEPSIASRSTKRNNDDRRDGGRERSENVVDAQEREIPGMEKKVRVRRQVVGESGIGGTLCKTKGRNL